MRTLLIAALLAVPLSPLALLPAQDPTPVAETAPPVLRLSLEEAAKLALANNLELRAAMLDTEIRRTQIQEALGTFDPTAFVDFTGGRSETLFAANFPSDPADPLSATVTRIITSRDDDMNLVLGVRGVLDTGTTYRLQNTTNYRFQQSGADFNPIWTTTSELTFTQPLLRAGWAGYHEAPVELARLGTLGAHQTWRGRVREKLKEVQQAYYDLVFATADLEVKIGSRELAKKQIEDTKLLVKTGSQPRVEITTAQSGLALREAEVVTAEAAKVEAEDRLRRLILTFDRESDWETRIVPTERAEEQFVDLRPLDEIIRMAEQVEPSVLEAHIAVAEAEVEKGQRESERQPKFDATGTVRVTGIADDIVSSERLGYESIGAFTWSVGLSLEYPLGNRAARARLLESELRLRKARIDLQNVRTELAFNVRSALRDIDVARRSIAARKAATALAAEQLKNERLRLELRTTTNFAVFSIEEDLSQRRTDQLRTIIDYRLALWELVRVTAIPMRQLVVTPPVPGPERREKD